MRAHDMFTGHGVMSLRKSGLLAIRSVAGVCRRMACHIGGVAAKIRSEGLRRPARFSPMILMVSGKLNIHPIAASAPAGRDPARGHREITAAAKPISTI